jgi:hypothetical protein
VSFQYRDTIPTTSWDLVRSVLDLTLSEAVEGVREFGADHNITRKTRVIEG